MKKDNLVDLYEIYHYLGGLYYADCEKTKSKCQEALNEYRNIDSTYPYYPYIILDITFLEEMLGNYKLALEQVNKLINIIISIVESNIPFLIYEIYLSHY